MFPPVNQIVQAESKTVRNSSAATKRFRLNPEQIQQIAAMQDLAAQQSPAAATVSILALVLVEHSTQVKNVIPMIPI